MYTYGQGFISFNTTMYVAGAYAEISNTTPLFISSAQHVNDSTPLFVKCKDGQLGALEITTTIVCHLARNPGASIPLFINGIGVSLSGNCPMFVDGADTIGDSSILVIPEVVGQSTKSFPMTVIGY